MIYITFQFFSFLDAILGTDSVSGGSSCIQAIFTLIESVRLGDQSDVEVDKEGGIQDDSSHDVRSLGRFTDKNTQWVRSREAAPPTLITWSLRCLRGLEPSAGTQQMITLRLRRWPQAGHRDSTSLVFLWGLRQLTIYVIFMAFEYICVF